MGEHTFSLSKNQSPSSEEERAYIDKVPYASIIGCLMHVGPHIAYVMGVVCKCMSNLGKQYWEVMKWIFRYLKGTENSTL